RGQLADGERFGQVIVGAELEAGDAVAFGAAGGEHEDGDRRSDRIAAQFAADGEAVDVGKVQIEDHEIEAAALHRDQPFVAVRVNRHAIIFALQVQAHGEGDVGIVFDQGDLHHSSAAARAVCLIIFPSTR